MMRISRRMALFFLPFLTPIRLLSMLLMIKLSLMRLSSYKKEMNYFTLIIILSASFFYFCLLEADTGRAGKADQDDEVGDFSAREQLGGSTTRDSWQGGTGSW